MKPLPTLALEVPEDSLNISPCLDLMSLSVHADRPENHGARSDQGVSQRQCHYHPHYYVTHTTINPKRIVLVDPALDLDAPHRARPRRAARAGAARVGDPEAHGLARSSYES